MEEQSTITLDSVLQNKKTNVSYPVLRVNDDKSVEVLGDNTALLHLTPDVIEKEYIITNKEKVNHPKHYNRKDAMECIDEMVMLFGVEETQIFCKLNAWKYRYRAADKGGVEDLEKSDWYIKKYKELTIPY